MKGFSKKVISILLFALSSVGGIGRNSTSLAMDESVKLNALNSNNVLTKKHYEKNGLSNLRYGVYRDNQNRLIDSHLRLLDDSGNVVIKDLTGPSVIVSEILYENIKIHPIYDFLKQIQKTHKISKSTGQNSSQKLACVCDSKGNYLIFDLKTRTCSLTSDIKKLASSIVDFKSEMLDLPEIGEEDYNYISDVKKERINNISEESLNTIQAENVPVYQDEAQVENIQENNQRGSGNDVGIKVGAVLTLLAGYILCNNLNNGTENYEY